MSVKYAYGYIRVSTHDQEEISPDSQEHLLRDYASKNNIVILKIFTDLGISGRKANKRPGFQEMIGLAKGDDHPVDQILVWKFSRFARNQEESIVYKSLLKKQHNVDVVSVSEPLSDNPFGSLIERIIEWMDEYYSIRLSGEVLRGMKENAARGAFQGAAPFGYKTVDKTLVIDPEKADIVRHVFNMYANEKLSVFDIARYLNNLGFRTIRGNLFERRTVKYMLKNPTYCGMIHWNKTENATHSIKNKDEWIVSQGQHPAIISQELFDATQERLKATRRPSRRRERPSSTYKHWLSGLMKCPACGKTLSACTQKRVNGEKYAYFSCYGYAHGQCDKAHGVSSLVLEPEVLAGIKEVLDTGNISYELHDYQPTEAVDERSIIKDRLNSLASKEERIKASYREGIDTLEEYKSNKAILQKERDNLEEQLKELEGQNPEPDQDPTGDMLLKVRSVYDILISDSYTYIQKNEALKQIVDKIIYDKESDSLKIYFFLCR